MTTTPTADDRAATLPADVTTSRTRRIDSLRNRVASRLANWTLLLASDDYRTMVGGAVRYGLAAAARDARDGIEPPKDWWK